jgi:hypothetical protein
MDEAAQMIDMNDIQAVDEVKAQILESFKAWKHYKKRNVRVGVRGDLWVAFY